MGQGRGGADGGRGVKVQVPDLGSHVEDLRRRLKAKAIQQQRRLVAHRAQARRLILPVPQLVSEIGVGKR